MSSSIDTAFVNSASFIERVMLGVDYQPSVMMGPYSGACDIGTGTASIEVDFQLLVKL